MQDSWYKWEPGCDGLLTSTWLAISIKYGYIFLDLHILTRGRFKRPVPSPATCVGRKCKATLLQGDVLEK